MSVITLRWDINTLQSFQRVMFQRDNGHAYSQIMREYHSLKKERGITMPKVLGLTACLVVKGTDEDKLRQDIRDLEQVEQEQGECCQYLTSLFR